MRQLVLLLLLGLLPVLVNAQEPPTTEPQATTEPQPAAEPAEEAVMACADCHTDQAAAFDTNPHRLIRTKAAPHPASGHLLPASGEKGHTPATAANAQCESCHGDGAAHIEAGGDTEKILVPRGRAGSDQTCLSCHDTSNDRISRHAGMHANSAAVNCLTCHAIHTTEPKSEHLLVTNELALCSGCHASQAASMRSKPYAHRVGRGAMQCSSCHEPHGRAGKESLKQTAAGESACISCHSDKRGLYVFPHGANSVGDCMSCHESHGSSNARQLKRARVEQVCIECHSPIGIGTAAATTLASQPPSFHNLSMARYQNCTTCHVAIHGSNRSPLLLK